MSTPIQISAKTLGQLALPTFCARCFWVWLRCRGKFPYSIFPGIFSSIDSFSKRVTAAHFAKHGRVPFWFDAFGKIGTPIRVPHWSKFNVTDTETNILLTGMPDEILRCRDNSLFVADYKCARFTETADELLPLYAVQLNCYGYIASRIGLGETSAAGLLYYEPQGDLPEAQTDSLIFKDSFFMRFTPKVHSIKVSPGMIPPLLMRVREIHDKTTPLAGAVKCKNCALLDTLLAVATKQAEGGARPAQKVRPPHAELTVASEPKRNDANAVPGVDTDTDLLVRLMRSNPTLVMIQVDGNGDFRFSVLLKDLTTSRRELCESPIAHTVFFGNFLGEWLLRRNVFEFGGLLTAMKEDEYRRRVTSYEHRHFGMVLQGDRVEFKFHASLVQSILTEDVKRSLEGKKT